jgi:hypothetical protein
VDGLIWAASMVVLDASRRNQRVPHLALVSLCAGIPATIGANLAHGLGHDAIGALVSAWPALALVGSFELLMLLVRNVSRATSGTYTDPPVPASAPEESATYEVVGAMYQHGASQRP